MPPPSLHKSLLSKRLRSHVDTEMSDTQPTRRQALPLPSHHPPRALPLTSYIGPPQPHPPPHKPNLQAPHPAPPDPFFPTFPEPLCFHLGCHALSPHTHAHGQHTGPLPSAETLRQQYEAVEVQHARQGLGKGLRATPRPSQKIRDAGTARHAQKLKKEVVAAQPAVSTARHAQKLKAKAPAVSAGLKPPGAKAQPQARRKMRARTDLAVEGGDGSKKILVSKPTRMKTRSQGWAMGKGSGVQSLEEGEQLGGVVRGVEEMDLGGE